MPVLPRSQPPLRVPPGLRLCSLPCRGLGCPVPACAELLPSCFLGQKALQMDPASDVVPGWARVKPSQDQARGRWTRREGLRSPCRAVALGIFPHPRSLFCLVHLFPGLRKATRKSIGSK